jgi:ElaB/YqjD/DUF883 family membrane-anchored ribosome-binding protein
MSTMTATKESLKDMKANAAELVDQFNEAGERLSKKANEALNDAKRGLYRMQDSTEEVVRETKHAIRKNPIGSVALAAGIAAGLGIFAGYLWGSHRD